MLCARSPTGSLRQRCSDFRRIKMLGWPTGCARTTCIDDRRYVPQYAHPAYSITSSVPRAAKPPLRQPSERSYGPRFEMNLCATGSETDTNLMGTAGPCSGNAIRFVVPADRIASRESRSRSLAAVRALSASSASFQRTSTRRFCPSFQPSWRRPWTKVAKYEKNRSHLRGGRLIVTTARQQAHNKIQDTSGRQGHFATGSAAQIGFGSTADTIRLVQKRAYRRRGPRH
jgi:hypothetical protein